MKVLQGLSNIVSRINLWILNQIRKLFKFFKRKNEIEIPETPYLVSTIGLPEVKRILKKICDVTHIYLSDWKYGLTSPALAKKFTRQSNIHLKQYVPEGRDCDEISLALYHYWNEPLENFAFGICWSGTHAFSLMIDHNHKLWFIEPQTNEWFKLEDIKDNKKYYPIKMIIM